MQSEPTKKRAKTLDEALDGVNKQPTTKGTLGEELSRLFVDEFVHQDGTVSKASLFDTKDTHYVGVPTCFMEKRRYQYAMTLAAMAISDENWSMLRSDTIGRDEKRKLVREIEKATLLQTQELETMWCDKPRTRRSKARAGMNTLGIRFKGITDGMKGSQKSDVEIENILATLTGDNPVGSQSSINSFFTKQKKK